MSNDLRATAPVAQNPEEEVEHAISNKPRPIARRTDWFWRNAHYRPRSLGRPPRDEGDAIALLRRAVQKGVTFIDTADSYGPDVSETLIAEALHPYPAGL